MAAKKRNNKRKSYKSKSKYRDALFRNFFNDKVRLLSLCNALLNTDCTNPEEITINTLDGIFFSQSKNDLSCLFRDRFLIIIEHQSTKNENMPLRMFFYAAELFKQYINDKHLKDKIYKEQRIHLPKPEFFVFYNGSDDEPESRIMSLSDNFDCDDSLLELKVKFYNLNEGNNSELLQHCQYLNHYCLFVNRVKRNLKNGMSIKEAINESIDYCCDNDIMAYYLNSKRKEIFDMINFEYNIKDAKKAWEEEAQELGRIEGENRLGQLISILLSNGKNQDAQDAAVNQSRRQELYQQYGI